MTYCSQPESAEEAYIRHCEETFLSNLSIAIQQSQPAATPQESRMQTITNNIVEPTLKAGNLLVQGDTVELSGRHSIVTSTGQLFCYDDQGVTAIDNTANYALINVAVAFNP